jgi:hypothetical protein
MLLRYSAVNENITFKTGHMLNSFEGLRLQFLQIKKMEIWIERFGVIKTIIESAA